ncbi:hypothetical protein BGX23_002537 [Mortierella sp. AD031]|nr:hypothetical protein BGX23_002537 [Mortierella sp. AD031]
MSITSPDLKTLDHIDQTAVTATQQPAVIQYQMVQPAQAPEEDDGVTVAINSKDLRHGAIEDAMGMKQYKRVTNIAIKGLSQLVIPILTGDTTNKILQFVTAVNLFLMSYKRIIDLRFYMLDALWSGTEDTAMICERYTAVIGNYPEHDRLWPVVSHALRKTLRISEFQLYLCLQFSRPNLVKTSPTWTIYSV